MVVTALYGSDHQRTDTRTRNIERPAVLAINKWLQDLPVTLANPKTLVTYITNQSAQPAVAERSTSPQTIAPIAATPNSIHLTSVVKSHPAESTNRMYCTSMILLA